MKIIGITRVRNEEDIIINTLEHVSKLVDNIIVVDDASTDATKDLCNYHPSVLKVIENKRWAMTPIERNAAEGELRMLAFWEAMKEKPDWIYYFDADEYADFTGIDFKADAYCLRLFDYYITKDDVDKDYLQREWLGREYRDILMLFRAHPDIVFHQREPNIPQHFIVKNRGYVKHYGKAISVEEWERTCDYYIKFRGGDFLPRFTEKWKARKGKAIHTISDFGTELIKWEDRIKKGIPLME